MSKPNTVPWLLDARHGATPDATAYLQERLDGFWQPTSWQAFFQRVTVFKRALSAAGLLRGDRLALIAPVSLEWELLHHAALAMGVVVVGLDAHDLPNRLAQMAEQADIVAFVTSDLHCLSELQASRWARTRFVLCLGEGEVPAPGVRRLTLQQLEALGATPLVIDIAPGPEDTATIIFTSGTTGAPKGIAYTHSQICLAIAAIADAFDFVGPGSRLLCWLPLSNLFQRMVSLAGMRQGAATYLLPDPRRVMEVVSQVSPDVFVGVPRFYEKLHEGIRSAMAAQPIVPRGLASLAWALGRRASRYRALGIPPPLWLRLTHGTSDRWILRRVRRLMGSRLKCLVTGSAPMTQHLLEEFQALGWPLLEAYGMSENVLPMAMNRLDDHRPGTVGRPVAGNDIVIGDDGRLKVRGPGVFSGYIGGEDRVTFDADGFYLTSDCGRFDSDGYLTLTGRADDVLKTSTGRRIAPAAAEARLRRAPGIDQALLVGNGRKFVVAICTCSGSGLDPTRRADLERGLREAVEELPDAERPRGVLVLSEAFSIEAGDLTPNLKMRRAAIERRHAERIEKMYSDVERRPGALSRTLLFLYH